LLAAAAEVVEDAILFAPLVRVVLAVSELQLVYL
jgi:hypothetical protein